MLFYAGDSEPLLTIKYIHRENVIDLNGSWQSATVWSDIIFPPGKWKVTVVIV